MPKTNSIRSSVSIEHRLVTDTNRHGHRSMASTAHAYHRAVKTGKFRRCEFDSSTVGENLEKSQQFVIGRTNDLRVIIVCRRSDQFIHRGVR